MIIIGLTGPSGSGKSYICSLFSSRAIPCLDTDRVCRTVQEKGTPCLDELCVAYGDGILHPDGTLNRAALADIVFCDREKLTLLNSIVHKYIRAETELWIAMQKRNGKSMVVVDAPVLFESGFDALCTCTVGVLCDYQTRLARLRSRDHISKESLRARMDAQPKDDFYISKCDYIIENNTDCPLSAQIDLLISQIGRRYGKA